MLSRLQVLVMYFCTICGISFCQGTGTTNFRTVAGQMNCGCCCMASCRIISGCRGW